MSITKFNFLIRDILVSTKVLCESPSSKIVKAQQEVQAAKVYSFELLIKTEEFIQLRNSITHLTPNGLASRALAIEKLQQELIWLSSCRQAELIDDFISLCRRYFLFCEMDRMAVQLEHYPKRADLIVDICCVYFYLSKEANNIDMKGRVLPNLSPQQVQEFLFETTSRKHWLEIMTEIALNHLEGIILKLPDQEKIDLYRNWENLAEQQSPLDLRMQLEGYFYETLNYLEDFLQMELDDYYKKSLLTVMASTASKSIIHKKLYQLEKDINLLVTPPEEMPRAQAVEHLKVYISQFYNSETKLESIYEAYLAEYNKFNEFDTKLMEFRRIVQLLYKGPRSLQEINSAINRAYNTYALNGDVTAAQQVLLEEVTQARKFIDFDHKTNGALSGFGIFQPHSSLVVAINRTLEILELDEKKVQPGMWKCY